MRPLFYCIWWRCIYAAIGLSEMVIMIKKDLIRVLAAWVVFEIVKWFLSFIVTPLLGSILPLFIDRHVESPGDMEWILNLITVSGMAIEYVASFVAFFFVCYLVLLRRGLGDADI